MKPTAPGSLSHIFAFAIYFSFAFIFRSIKLKIQKYLAAIYSYLLYLAFGLSVYYKFISRLFAYLEAPLPDTTGIRHFAVCHGRRQRHAWRMAKAFAVRQQTATGPAE